MTDSPFSNKPTIVDEVEDDDENGGRIIETSTVQEEYERVPATGNDVEDETGESDEEWAGTPTAFFGNLEQEKFEWVFVTLEDRFRESGEYEKIPVIQDRFDNYEDLVEAREETDEEIPEGIHVQHKSSSKVRYAKGDDEDHLLEKRGLK